MSNYESKLKLSFNPCELKPITINSENRKTIISKLKEFDKEFILMRDSIRASIWDSMLNPIWNSMSYSIWNTNRTDMLNSIWKSMQSPILDLIDGSQLYSSLNTIWASMWDQMWSSILITLSKEEYEILFEDKQILKELSYEKVKKLCDLYHWFSSRGLFPYKSINKNEYILGSWKYPRNITTVNIQ